LELEEVLQPNEDVALLNNKHLLCEEEHKEVVLVVAAAIVLVLILELVRAQHIAVVRRAMMLSIIEHRIIFSLNKSSYF
jgi:ADP-ribosylglycohydrolase